MNSNEFEETVRDFNETQHLIPHTIENKDQYYSDLWNIINSWSGRIDVYYSNKFFIEAQRLITNSIVLFEKGYFDCAFYSLRQSIEVSLTIAFFAEHDDSTKQSEMFAKWINKEKFPMQGQMIEEMKKRLKAYAEIKEKMTDFFTQLEAVKHNLNKYVHKQGYDAFYGHRSDENVNEQKNDFISALEMSISAIAVHRLVIDPLPVLLMDETIYKKSGDMLTEAFSDQFVEKYLSDFVEQFKQTQMYIDYYNHFDAQETMLPAVLDIVKDQFVDREKFDEISSQIHLLGLYDRIAVGYFMLSPKIAQVHLGTTGLMWYFSNVKSQRQSSSFSSKGFAVVKDSNKHFNNPYDGAYLSFIQVHENEVFLEHNETFDQQEIEIMNHFKEQFEEAIKKAEKEIEDLISSADTE